jgi:hypothetical protein
LSTIGGEHFIEVNIDGKIGEYFDNLGHVLYVSFNIFPSIGVIGSYPRSEYIFLKQEGFRLIAH